MTISQAHRFVGRWRRVLIPWPNPFTEADAARAMQQGFLGLALGPLPACIFAYDTWPMSILVPAGATMLLCYWLSLRFQAAQRLLKAEKAAH